MILHKSSTLGYRRVISSPSVYTSFDILSLTEPFSKGYERFMIIRSSFESLFGLVSIGEKWACLPNGFRKKGPIIAPCCSSFCMYSSISCLFCSAPFWFWGMLRYRSRCQDDIFPRIELIPSFVSQVIILIARMTFNCSTSCLMS